jgi:carboxypeptidase PM20D1
MIRTTIGFTTAKGSDGLNVLPQEAYVTGNMRFIQHQPTQESIAIIAERAKKYDLETEVIYAEEPFPIVDYKGNAFKLIEAVAADVYPGLGISPYCMTGGTDAKFYVPVCDNCIRFAPLFINAQQYGSIHGLNENINQGVLSYGVDFYKTVIKRSHEFL